MCEETHEAVSPKGFVPSHFVRKRTGLCVPKGLCVPPTRTRLCIPPSRIAHTPPLQQVSLREGSRDGDAEARNPKISSVGEAAPHLPPQQAAPAEVWALGSPATAKLFVTSNQNRAKPSLFVFQTHVTEEKDTLGEEPFGLPVEAGCKAFFFFFFIQVVPGNPLASSGKLTF